MNLVDGRRLAAEIADEVSLMVGGLEETPQLIVLTCDPNFETKKFLALKQAKAEVVGVEMRTVELPAESTTEQVLEVLKLESEKAQGIIVQLPLPKRIDTDLVLKAIPKEKDVDRFDYAGEKTDILPPVVGAIDEISKYYGVKWQNKQVVVFGQGRLVGEPAALYAKGKGAEVTIITEDTKEVDSITQKADIVILGVGQPNLLTKEMVKDGVVVFDAGASEDGGLLVGDANVEVGSKAALLTPVPGGIGPMTVILLFRNLLKLCASQ